MSLAPQWLDELRSRVSLSGVVSRTTRLTKAGREFKACCPFHNEKTPSFTVNDDKGFYHCFGCGAHGDVIRWMTDQRGLAFMDAVKELASEAGMELPAPDPKSRERDEKRQGLDDIMMAAQAWFVDRLGSDAGTAARKYLATRGFSKQTVERFGFGYAPEDRQALKTALSRFPEPQLVEAGLRIAVEERNPCDRFRGRLMLPIRSPRGKIVGFGGRILNSTKTDSPKYLNSPDTPIFDKGRTLFNLDRAAPVARKSGRLIVVEGYMDVVALDDVGIDHAVAPLGTALTEAQLELAWGVTDNPILCFDGDSAGQRAAMRAVTRALPFLRADHSLRIMTLPSGMDPDDVVKVGGSRAFELQVEEALNIADFLWMQEKAAAPTDSPEEKAGLNARIQRHLDAIIDPHVRKLYKQHLDDEYSRFAFPRGDLALRKRKRSDATDGRVAKRRLLAKMDIANYLRYMRKRLGAAIARGLMYWPETYFEHSSALEITADVDMRIDAIIEVANDREDFNMANFLVRFAKNDLMPPVPDEFDYLRFPFAWPYFSREDALPALKRAIEFYTLVPEIQRAIKIRQRSFEADFVTASEEDAKYHESESSRLRQRLNSICKEAQAFEKEYEPT